MYYYDTFEDEILCFDRAATILLAKLNDSEKSLPSSILTDIDTFTIEIYILLQNYRCEILL